jgi:hypothetical protein
LVARDLPALLGTGFLERLDDAGNDAGKITLGVRRVAALDNVVAREGEVIANENATAEANPDRKLLVVAVPQADHIGVVAIGRLQRQDAEVARTIRGDGVVFLDNLMAEVAQAVLHHIDDIGVRDRDVALGGLGDWQLSEVAILNDLSSRVQTQGHGTSPLLGNVWR